MCKFTSRSALITVLCLSAVLGFAGGIVCARAAFPSLERAINDYHTLSSDLRAAIDEVEKKKASATQEQLLKLRSRNRELQAELERMTESQQHVDDIWKDLEGLYGTSDPRDMSPPPSRKRP
jgi:hypothetical protein